MDGDVRTYFPRHAKPRLCRKRAYFFVEPLDTTLTLRIVLQRNIAEKVAWDRAIVEETVEKWICATKGMKPHSSMRCLVPPGFGKIKSPELAGK